MPTNAINDTGVKYLYDKLHGEIEPIAEAVSDREVTIKGNPLNFNTLSSQNAKSTILSVAPIQDLHGYDKPWVGGAGKNKIDVADKTMTSGYIIDSISISIPAGTYTLSFDCSNGSSQYQVKIKDSDDNDLDSVTKSCVTGHNEATLSIGDTGALLLTYTNNSNNAKYSNFQLESGPTFTSFAPYTNLCPITGRSEIGILGCGKNLINPVLGGYDVTGTGTMRVGFAPVWLNPGTYTASFKSHTPSNTVIYITNITNNYSYEAISESTKSITFTLTEKSQILIRTSQALEYIDSTSVEEMQLEKNNAKTDYSPYTESNDLTISLGQTVYGGTLDVENGVLVVEKQLLDWTNVSDVQSTDVTHLFKFTPPSAFRKGIPTTSIIDGVASQYEAMSRNLITTSSKNGFAISDSGLSMFVYDDRYGSSDVNDFETQLKQSQLVLPLKTPTEISLTPHTINLLKGVNNISTDGDKITLTYRDGKVATLGDLTSAVDELDGKIDESKILTDTATGDKYILVVTNGVLSVEQVSN